MDAAGRGNLFHARLLVGIFVGTGWINILPRHGSFSGTFLDMVAAEPTNKIRGGLFGLLRDYRTRYAPFHPGEPSLANRQANGAVRARLGPQLFNRRVG